VEFGCSFGGPMLFSYVEWVIERCIEMGISHLYFVARDGYVLKKIADSIIRVNNYLITTKYIYGSRNAWRMSSVTQDNFNIDFVFNEAWALTDLNSLAAIMGLKMSELANFLPEKFSNGYYEPSNKEIAQIKSILCDNSKFRDFLCKKNKSKRLIVQEYLKQEINWQEDKFAFVELRGTGKTMQCIADIVLDFWDNPIKVFYLELLEICRNKNCVQYNWLPSRLYLAQVLETLCRATHGQTLEYHKIKDGVMPVLEDREGEALKKYGYEDYINGVEQYAKRFAASLRQNGLYVDGPKIFMKYLDYLTKTPDREMLDFIGDMPFKGSSVTDNNEVGKFAPVLTREDVERIYKNTSKDRLYLVYNGSALEFSEMRTSGELHKYIKYLKSCK